MPQKIIIVRHGETQWNVERRLQGWTDIPLNDHGHEQAKLVADRLKTYPIDVIYTSDHQRAHQTAAHIAQFHSLTPINRRELREDGMGILEGWAWESEPDESKQSLWQARDEAHAKGDIEWGSGGIETLKAHTARVKKLIDQIEAEHQDKTVVIVTHGGTINRLMEVYGFKQISDEYVGYQNTSVTILTKDNTSYTRILHNDISHLNL